MSERTNNGVDRRALKILFDTYWSARGWRDNKSISTPRDDFEYAKRAGVMFDSVVLSHDDVVKRATSAVCVVDRRKVADAFVLSLSSRRLDIRSALGSFSVLQHFPRHKASSNSGQCAICGEWMRKGKAVPHDLNVLNFERWKWGGVRHDDPVYAAFDLELFSQTTLTSPSHDEVQVLNDLLDAIDRAPSNTSAAALQKILGTVFKSSKAERDILIGILGLCGILRTKSHDGYRSQFVPFSARELPPRHFVDMDYPACRWKRTDDIDWEAVNYWFGHLM